MSKVIADPFSGLTDVAFDVGGDLLMKKIGLKGSFVVGTVGEVRTEQRDEKDSQCTTSQVQDAGTMQRLGDRTQSSHWSKLRGVVMGVGGFREASNGGQRRARDDSCISCRSSGTAASGTTELADLAAASAAAATRSGGGGEASGGAGPWASIAPAHRAALSMMLSMMIGGLSPPGLLPSQGAMAAVSPEATVAAVSSLANQAVTMSHSVVSEAMSEVGPSGVFKAMDGSTIKFTSSLRAPSLRAPSFSGPTAAENLVGAGGMAMSTALRMLRAGE